MPSSPSHAALPIRVLIVDDSPAQGEWLRTTTENFCFTRVGVWPSVTLEGSVAAVKALLDHGDHHFDLVISDLCLTDSKTGFEGLEVLRLAKAMIPEVHRILVSSRIDVSNELHSEGIVARRDWVYIGGDGMQTTARVERLERALKSWLDQFVAKTSVEAAIAV